MKTDQEDIVRSVANDRQQSYISYLPILRQSNPGLLNDPRSSAVSEGHGEERERVKDLGTTSKFSWANFRKRRGAMIIGAFSLVLDFISDFIAINLKVRFLNFRIWNLPNVIYHTYSTAEFECYF